MEIGSEEHRQRKMAAFVSPVKQLLVPTSGSIIYFLYLVGAFNGPFPLRNCCIKSFTQFEFNEKSFVNQFFWTKMSIHLLLIVVL